MTRKTTAICYTIAGVCFAISGAAGLVAGRTGYAVIRVVLGAAMIFLAVTNYRFYKNGNTENDENTPGSGEE